MAIAMISLFGSCSRQTTSMTHYNRLDNAQTLGNDKPLPMQKESEISAQISTPAQACDNNTITMPAGKNIEISATPIKKSAHKMFVQTLTKNAEKTIMKQTAVVKNLVAPSHAIASFSSTKDHGGLLGLAITLLIIGVVLFFLGFGSLGALFWTIGIILLVIALVFFLLWMVGRAVN